MTYEADLAAARAAGTAWPCHCGAGNPGHYDSCHDCQTPSWDCRCGAVNCGRNTLCRTCGSSPGASSRPNRRETTR